MEGGKKKKAYVTSYFQVVFSYKARKLDIHIRGYGPLPTPVMKVIVSTWLSPSYISSMRKSWSRRQITDC